MVVIAKMMVFMVMVTKMVDDHGNDDAYDNL